MSQINVQFSDASQTTVIAYLGSPQDPVHFHNQGQIEASDPRWKVYYDSLPPAMQEGLPEPV